MANPLLLITGASGRLGSALAAAAGDTHRVLAVGGNRRPPGGLGRDLTVSPLKPFLDAHRPDLVVHAAALSRPDHCEREPARAWRLHRDATAELAAWCRHSGAWLLFISTDLVFDGRRGGYTETDPTRPIGVYAESKVAGERATLDGCPGAGVVRTSLLYGDSPSGDPGADGVVRAELRAGRPLTLYADEYRTPIHLADLVRVLLTVLAQRPAGVLHAAGPRRLSRLEFGRLTARLAGLDESLLRSGRLAEHPGFPPRCPDVSLDISRLRRLTGWCPAPPETALAGNRTGHQKTLDPDAPAAR